MLFSRNLSNSNLPINPDVRKSTRGDRVGGEETRPDPFSQRVFGQAEYGESSPPMALSSFSFLLASANAGVIAVGEAR